MSKSLGNVTCPFELLVEFGADSVRAYFLSEGPAGSRDCNFDYQKLLELHNNFLADSYVNMINRVKGKKVLK